ncbi:tetratricopeptide repeat-containing sensor histidine kinase [Taibaiella soli]|uniref:histidine kinase n=1 Tax=Taibaiella soli TaxID=1649169 RepID=A0A2W2ADV6_9BACT|nr:sensor histidine kinase [Taibaiella soli]PZF73645.1 hypothetical protein DN068_06500 [Taibaiella soli]
MDWIKYWKSVAFCRSLVGPLLCLLLVIASRSAVSARALKNPCIQELQSISTNAQKIFMNTGFRDSVDEIHRDIAQMKTAHDTQRVRQDYMRLSDLFINFGQTDSSLYFLNIAETLVDTHSPQLILVNVYLKRCKTYFQKGSLDTALLCAYRGLHMLDQTDGNPAKEARLRARFYIYISMVFVVNNHPDLALVYCNKSESIVAKLGDNVLAANLLMLKAGISSADSTLFKERSIELYSRAAEFSIAHDNPDGAAVALVNMSVYYYEHDSLCAAVAALKKVFTLSDAKFSYTMLSAYSTIGEIYFTQGEYARAEQCFKIVIDASRKYNIREGEYHAHDFLYKIYREQGNYNSALDHLEQFYLQKEKREGNQLTSALTEMEMRYKTEEKDKQIVKQQLQIANQENRLKTYAIVGGSVVVIAIFLLLLFRIRGVRQLSKIQVLRKEQQIGNLKAVLQGEEQERARIASELHDGIGAKIAVAKLNIDMLTKRYPMMGDLSEVLHILEETSDEIRETSHNLLPNVLAKNTLQEALIQYCNSINSTALQMHLQFEDDIADYEGDVKLTLYRILQELLQNIVKHAQASKVYIQIRERGDTLRMTIEDDGKGFDPSEISGGLGLEHVKIRVRSLDGTLVMDSDALHGSTFFITFPLSTLRKTHLYDPNRIIG